MNDRLSDKPWWVWLRCVNCRKGALDWRPDTRRVFCQSCLATFPVFDNRPVLIRDDNEIFPLNSYRATYSTQRGNESSLGRLVPGPSVNLARKRVLTILRERLRKVGESSVLVVGGGRQRRGLDECLSLAAPSAMVYIDIDQHADVDVFCDAHELPYFDRCFDAVVTTAVLEHVLYPEVVASEIRRVLKLNGLLYSEVPFMQQVHEGAYDFTRYTLSGHRRLFNGFKEIESGMVAGPATALVWAIENFALAFVVRSMQRRATKALVRFSFGWLRYFDHLLVNRPEAMDGASCTFFFGLKIEGRVPDKDIVAHYVGAKHVQHF